MISNRHCRACRKSDLFEVLDLGSMPLAGDFRKLGEANKLYPLAIDGCESCGALQVREAIDHSILFNSHYAYVSSTIPALVKHFENYASAVALPPDRKGSKTLLEIGCNDGIFLLPLRRSGYRVTGIDASKNVALMARDKGLDVKIARFNLQSAKELLNEYGPFDVVTCSNVFAHNPDVNEFAQAVCMVLNPSGEFWVEVHSAHGLYTDLQWDCFYHEHCFYWTIHALSSLLERYGLKLKKYETTPMHGGALRAAFSRRGRPAPIQEPPLTPKAWIRFGQRCHHNRALIQSSLSQLPIKYAYGAAGRAVMLINWTGIAKHLEFVVDGSPLRYGKAIPNTSVPIISEEEFFKEKNPDGWCFVTAHNYLAGIRKKVEDHFPKQFIRFVTPLPDVQIQ